MSTPADPRPKQSHLVNLSLAGLLAFAATGHFRKPEFFDSMIPTALPGRPRDWVIGSGVAEAATAALIAFRPTRRVGGLVAAALFIGVFPGNAKMVIDAWQDRDDKPVYFAISLARLPLQIPLILWALRVRRSTPPR